MCFFFFFYISTSIIELYPLSLHDALPICDFCPDCAVAVLGDLAARRAVGDLPYPDRYAAGLHLHGVDEGLQRSEEHTSELQSRGHLVCRLLLEKKKHKHDVCTSLR